jgi:hypothetical protein
MSKRGSHWIRAAAAVAATLAAGTAGALETRGALYGDLRLSLDHTDDEFTGPTFTATDNQSIWGLKFSTDRGGIKVFGAYERFIDADDPPTGTPVELTRLAYLGLASVCGTIKFGRHTTTYADAGRKLDPFYNTTVSGTDSALLAGSLAGGGNSHGTATAFNADAYGNAYVADHLAYESPAFFGVRGNAALFLDESGTDDQDHDYGGGLEYADHGLTAGAQILDVNGANATTWGADLEAARVYAGYAQPGFGAGVSWERLDLPGAVTANYLMVSGWYGVRDDTRIAVSVGAEDDTPTRGDSLRAGVFHDVIENFTIWAAGRYYNHSGAANADANVVTIGASYKFSLGFTTE